MNLDSHLGMALSCRGIVAMPFGLLLECFGDIGGPSRILFMIDDGGLGDVFDS